MNDEQFNEYINKQQTNERANEWREIEWVFEWINECIYYPFRPEFNIVIFIHYKSRIAVAIRVL